MTPLSPNLPNLASRPGSAPFIDASTSNWEEGGDQRSGALARTPCENCIEERDASRNASNAGNITRMMRQLLS